ncbi:hypothetical protein HOU95_gp058 [Streptomyces phage Hiyaa]|jgi:hypothetical protein|uniref:Uncharacterized protein n=1 Tax=Streptomyces phage Hiyaa TaxID=2499072 RepID=A0A3S9U961_9CAUD|nr:hypothetical protein HOU95_gp058 [Streptomyces phage Hiyaa]AZS06749.1 hypothetical protein SEA_HIYAA_110 [Streptomyces phage Hiyaa]
MSRKAIRPSNRVQVGASQTGRVVMTGKHKQGGTWVRTYKVRFDTDAIRTVRGHLVQPV